MAEETQVLSIQDRIRALKQAQSQTQSTDAEGTSPFLGSQPTAFALRPASSHSNGVSTPPPPYSSQPPPPPVGRKSPALNNVPPRPAPRSVSTGGVSTTPDSRQQPKKPPPLPARKSSSQQLAVPSLPPRRPSIDSIASDASRSTATSTGKSTGTGTATRASTPGSVVKAPPWGATELPPLPAKRQNTQPAVSPSKPKPTTLGSNGRLPPPRPVLPPRRSSGVSTVSTESSAQSRPTPPLPQRRDPSPNPSAQETNGQGQERRLPPPAPSGAALDKIRITGFGGLTKRATGAAEAPASVGAPPPVPTGSRPDLSAIQATKPRVAVSNAVPAAAAPVAACLKCRDFSAPDAHAALYPRQSLPSQDLGWLARELTAPFISATDKARVIFTWLHHNIDYDTVSFFNGNVKPATPDSTFATGLAVCEGYAKLFATLAAHAGLEAKVVSGHGKGFSYNAPAPGASLPAYSPTGHAWNVVRIDNGQWKLIDPCWGAGHIQGKGQPYVRSFNPAMFTNTNDEFGLKHFPSDRAHFYRDDGRPEITWEEYIVGNPNSPLGAAQPMVWGDAKKHSIGERSFRPAAAQISIRDPGPMRFQFNLICEHWSLEKHSRAKPGLFLLMTNGLDGRDEQRIPLVHWRGTGANGGGDVWYIDVLDPRTLGAPGQKVRLAVLTKFGDRDARGVTVEEYQQQVGRVGMAWAYIADWELVV
ncbi:uncharacterized protein DSM5745_05906 [Aspergillus mulundensis]|uniref:Transglutaminase-like domain-containing protein n=1 Tax=Aspergillus mulundensis TaxID=1810919 RepID=A0A3D8RYW8_9EURO|nr:Uncharacterized protein DSM5745_05906 [Aspergillus mulundensis]RDW79054.1 Uncharacterized protein DSM5745_05906 [Aspergillus mulundensis]